MPDDCLHIQPDPPKPKGKLRYSNAFADAKELQRLLMRDARNPEVKPAVLASLARSFCELEECKRKLKMRPLPRSIDTTKLPPKGQGKAKAQGFSEA